MSEFVMVRRELLERRVKNTDFFEDLKGVSMHDINEAKKEDEKITEELRAVLAQEAGHVEEPLGMVVPIYQVQYLGDGGGGWSDAEKDSYDAKVPHPKHWMTRIVYASPPAPVAVVINEMQAFSSWLHETVEFTHRADGVSKVQRKDIMSLHEEKISYEAWSARACLDKVKELNQ